MIFGRINTRVLSGNRWLFINSLIIEQPKHSITTRTNTTSSSDNRSQQNTSYRNVALVLASTAMIGLVKLYDYAIGYEKKGANHNDLKEKYFYGLPSILNGKNLQAKEDKKDEISEKEKLLVITPRQKLFFQFASVELDGLPYMTPQDFLESVTEDHPRPRMRRKILTHDAVKNYLKNTPGRDKGSPRLFRNLEEKGLISYSEYLFLLCVITKPKSNFRIAFNMFDRDGNEKVDKREFLVVTQIFQRGSEPKKTISENETQKNFDQKFEHRESKLMNSMKAIDLSDFVETSLLVHLFGPKGKKELEFGDFQKFSNDLQREILEIEFNEFSKGMNKISSIEFAEILLRYTKFSHEKKVNIIKRLTQDEEAFYRGISFEKFYEFSMFMNNLDDFSLALKFHTLANRAISTNEFQRAVKISSGFTLDEQIVKVIFNTFDENNDGQLSYKEFIAILRGRLRRGLKSVGKTSFELSNYTSANDLTQSDLLKTNDEQQSIFQTFKNCVKRKLRENNYE